MTLRYKGRLFHGDTCSCCVSDGKPTRSDPTGTIVLRRKFVSDFRLKWNSLRAWTRKMLIDQDLLSLSSTGLTSPANPMVVAGQTRIQMWQAWFDFTIGRVVLQSDGMWMRQYIEQAYNDGAAFARDQIKRPVVASIANANIATLWQWSVVELQGIDEAVSQQSVRAVATELLHKGTAQAVVRDINAVIEKIGVTRGQALVQTLVNKAFNTGVLDVYDAAGVKQVSPVAETIARARVGDARRGTGPGSRISRALRPSSSTIGRIARAALEVELLGEVNVRTAGDDNVCPICEGIAEEGPYDINVARSLIPAHPNCRCTFIPAGDRRFASDRRRRHEVRV